MKDKTRVTAALAFHVSLLPTAALSVALTAPVIAQGAETSAGERAGSLEEIIVTARRREESIQDVPISISVFNQETLDERNVVTASDLAIYTPSLSVNNRFGPDQSSFAIRGFTQELRTTASVGVYFADVVAPRGGGSVTAGDGAGPGSFFDLQNVQVLKGPQGTLFGRNTTGGAVLLVPQKPSDELEGYIEATGGDFDLQRGQGVLNVPMGERLRARFGVDYQKRDGYLKNVGVGPEFLGDVDYIAGRASLVWDMTDSIENYTILSYVDSKNNGVISNMFACNPDLRNGRRIGFATFCDAQMAEQGDDYYTLESATDDPYNELKQWQATNTTTWLATDNLTIKNIISFSDIEQTTKGSVFGTYFPMPAALPIVGGLRFSFTNSGQVPGVPTNSQKGVVEELQFQGRLFDARLNWQGGFYYENSKPDGWSGSQSLNQLYCADDPGTDPATFQCQDLLRTAAWFGLRPTVPTLTIDRVGATGNVQRQLGKVEYENKAVYSQATYSFTDAFKLTGGLRYTWDETTGSSQQIVYRGFNGLAPSAPGALPVPVTLPGVPFVPPGVPMTTLPAIACVITTAAMPDCVTELEQKSDAPTWLVGLDYLPTDDVMLYAKYTRGYRQGAINIFGAEGYRTHEPEKVDAYEVGAKTSFHGAVPGTLNVAVFHNDLQDQQIQIGFQDTAGRASPTTGILNAGKSTIQGVEVESALVFFRDLRFDVSYTYLDTELNELVIPPPSPSSLYDSLTPAAIQGGPLALSPENRVSATLTYRFPLPESVGNLSLGANWVYTDEQLTSASQPFGTLPSYDLANFNLNWKAIFGSSVDASAFVTNALDEEYPVYVPGLYPNLGAEFRVVGQPRMWGVRLRYSFGGER